MIYESDYYVGSDLNGDSLSHHGVPNQKWGVKNGPPYPIKRGHDVNYNVGKMTSKTKAGLQKAGKIAGEKVTNAAKTVAKKTSTSFQKWKDDKKMELATKDTNSTLMKNWQKKQLRISDMSNQELQARIDRKKLEAVYKHALRGDFSDPKNWKNSEGKKVADGILKKIGNAAVDGVAKGLTNKISETMTAKAKANTSRKEARKNAIEEVRREAAKEREQYRSDHANQAWRERQERRNEDREYWRSTHQNNSGDGAMDPGVGPNTSGNSGARSSTRSYSYTSPYTNPVRSPGIGGSSTRTTRAPGLGGSTAGTYWPDPDEWNIR